MKNSVFLSFSLILTSAIAYFYGEVRYYFNRPEIYVSQINELKHEISAEKFRRQLASYEFQDFREYVATLLPNQIKTQDAKSYQMRSLASVVQKSSNEPLMVQRAREMFERGKALFRDKKYTESNKTFVQLLRDHPYSAQVPEAMFLLVEGYFQLQEYDQVIAYANKMVDLYPELEVTGYALLRAGKVYETQERHDEAMSIYQTVMRSFPSRGLASIAQDALREIQL
jgi:TolA-binding protein